MKRLAKLFSMLLLAVVVMFGATSCHKNKGSKTTGVVVEQTINTSRAYMCDNYGCVYVWYESSIMLNHYLDAEECDGSVFGVTNVFQVNTEGEDGYDAEVVMFTHAADSMMVKEVPGFWVEDFELASTDVVLTFRQAYERMMQSNYPKPHSKFCVLRKEVGPINCNPQYIFGNRSGQIYVDAKTGRVSSNNPAFPSE